MREISLIVIAIVLSVGISAAMFFALNNLVPTTLTNKTPTMEETKTISSTGNQTRPLPFNPGYITGIGIVFAVIVASSIVIPLIYDQHLAYSKKHVNAAGKTVGLEGLGRTMTMIGIVLVLGLVLFYLLGTFTFTLQTGNKFSDSMFEVIKNTTTILAGAVSAIIAFYFGSRAMESGMEKAKTISSGITEEKTGPRIIYTEPPNGADQINTSADIKAAFNTRIDASTIESPAQSFKVKSGNVPIIGDVTLVGDSVAKFDPQNPLPVGKITCTVTKEVKDIEGNTMQEEYGWWFKTI